MTGAEIVPVESRQVRRAKIRAACKAARPRYPRKAQRGLDRVVAVVRVYNTPIRQGGPGGYGEKLQRVRSGPKPAGFSRAERWQMEDARRQKMRALEIG